MKDKIRIGCGAGFSGDRLDPSIVLVEKGSLNYLVLECLAERTIALAQKRKLQDPSKGYDPLLERRIESLIDQLVDHGVCLITNMGAANPIAAAEKVAEIARARNVNITIAAVTGDDVFDKIDFSTAAMETNRPITDSGKPVSANAYLGAAGIVDALKNGANVIITGRVADPSLFIAPMIHEFGWAADDFDLLGKGTVIGHLMECAGHITGGYFADPGKKDVPDMAHLGHPFVDVHRDGSGLISKVEGTGGIINLSTAKEQLLYEVVNPFEYYTPDVIADFTSVQLKQMSQNVVKVSGGTGKERPSTYKVSVGYQAFYLGEGEITYGGYNALGRAKLAGDTIKQRLRADFPDLRIDLIGHSSLHGEEISVTPTPYEVRLRVAGTSQVSARAAIVGEEVEALYTNGPAGGGGVRKSVTEVIGIVSTLISREQAAHKLTLFQS